MLNISCTRPWTPLTGGLRGYRAILSSLRPLHPHLLVAHYRHQHRQSHYRATDNTGGSKSAELNGPPTSRPPPLTIPVRAPDESILRFTLRRGRAYGSFYKAGIKNVFTMTQAARAIRRRVRADHNGLLKDAVTAGALTRREFLTVIRAERDLRKIPLFLLIVLLTGELSPIVLLFFNGLVPGPCRSPADIAKTVEQQQTRRERVLETIEKLKEQRRGVDTRNGRKKTLNALDRVHLRLAAVTLGLYSSRWDRLEAVSLPPTYWIRKRVQAAMTDLSTDDSLLRDRASIAELEEVEVQMALLDRGVDIRRKDPTEMQEQLQAWLRETSKGSIGDLLIQRYALLSHKARESAANLD